MKDFDKPEFELDKNLGKVDAELKNLNFAKLQKDAAELALKEIDINEIMKNVELALKNVDMEKIMARASKELEKAKVELKAVDKEAIQKKLENAKKEIEKSKPEFNKIDINKIRDEARAGIDKAKDELKFTKEMFTEMEKEGLINLKAGFTNEYRNKQLYTDGKKQDEKTTGRYRKYFRQDHFKVTIDKE